MPSEIHAVVDPAAGRVEARTASGQPISLDADPPHGADSAASPMEALLAALAGCAAMDVCAILRKKRQSAASYALRVTGAQAEVHPKVFSDIVVEHVVVGAVEPEPLRRSIELSATRYCPVNAMLSAVARIEHRYELTDESGAVHRAVVAIVGPDRRIEVVR